MLLSVSWLSFRIPSKSVKPINSLCELAYAPALEAT
jgi:hypothetical protein